MIIKPNSILNIKVLEEQRLYVGRFYIQTTAYCCIIRQEILTAINLVIF